MFSTDRPSLPMAPSERQKDRDEATDPHPVRLTSAAIHTVPLSHRLDARDARITRCATRF